MARKWENDKPKIQMLLDIENVFGESTRGLGKFLLTLFVALIPVAIIAVTAAYLFIPWQILLAVSLIWAIRAIMIIGCDENARVRTFKLLRDDSFAVVKDLIRLWTIHVQGFLEYVNGSVAFFIVTYNDSSEVAVQKSVQINRFINLAVGKHPFDVYIQNITSTDQLDSRYNNVKLFSDSDAANAFMEIIDFNRKAVEESSTLTRNVICIRGSKYQWKEIMGNIETALHSESARVFRTCYLATDRDEIEDIVSRDIDGRVDFEELLQKKYYTGNKRGSKVISYDFADIKESQEKSKDEDGAISFIPEL